jgi:hypothetical protein
MTSMERDIEEQYGKFLKAHENLKSEVSQLIYLLSLCDIRVDRKRVAAEKKMVAARKKIGAQLTRWKREAEEKKTA